MIVPIATAELTSTAAPASAFHPAARAVEGCLPQREQTGDKGDPRGHKHRTV
jgi:hypothetical protein